MKRITCLTLLASLLLLASPTYAQKLIAVQNGGNPKFYEKLEDAISNAVAKDTIYVPGGVFQNISENTLTINKVLHLIGAGHNPDSTTVTNPTYITASIVVVSGSNKSTFEGFLLTGNFATGSSTLDEDVDDITISRCNIGGLLLSNLSSSWIIHENIISGGSQGNYQSVSSPYAQNNLFSNNIIGSLNYFGSNNQFRNNIVYNPNPADNFESCFFENNISFYGFPNGGLSLCTLNNNLFIYNGIPEGNFGSNNISEGYESIFIKQSGYFSFNYSDDYHLQPTCPGKNAGKDGTDIGIYGGLYPWKAGSVPSNPHIQFKQVSGTTNTNGNLNVKIKVAAQDH